jgi:hemoglobin
MRSLVLVILVTGISAPAIRADNSPSQADVDKLTRNGALDVVKYGTDIFNAGDHAGCYRLYEGALWSLKPLLGHRPDVVRTIDAQMAKARSEQSVSDKAFALRTALDAIIAEKAMMKPPVTGKKPLWDRLGGEAGVRAVTQEFLITASKDPKANIDRNGNYPLTPQRVARVEQLVVEFISSVTGGPIKYTGRDMKNAHLGMKITEDEFNISAKYLIDALKKYQVPQAEIDELVGLVSGVAKDIIEVKK